MAGPLAGIKVIEVGQALAGPLAGAILSDMGADVIKVEKPDGGDDARMWGPPFVDDYSLMFHSTNRNKRSVTHRHQEQSRHRAAEAAGARRRHDDPESRPGIVEEVGIGPDVMRSVNPRLIYCSIWAFGNKGPMRNRAGL